MNRCPVCYHTHDADVEVCDCGQHLLSRTPSATPTVDKQDRAVRCPTCGGLESAPVSQENDGFGLVTVTVCCAQCRHLFEVKQRGAPQSLLVWLRLLAFLIWFVYFSDEILRSFILMLLALMRVVQSIFAWLDERES